MPTGPWYRLLVAVVGAVVAWANATYGIHLAARDVLTIIIGVISGVLIVMDGHVEATKHGASFDPAKIVSALLDAFRATTNKSTVTTTADQPEQPAKPAS